MDFNLDSITKFVSVVTPLVKPLFDHFRHRRSEEPSHGPFPVLSEVTPDPETHRSSNLRVWWLAGCLLAASIALQSDEKDQFLLVLIVATVAALYLIAPLSPLSALPTTLPIIAFSCMTENWLLRATIYGATYVLCILVGDLVHRKFISGR
jgi:hypothetical protein